MVMPVVAALLSLLLLGGCQPFIREPSLPPPPPPQVAPPPPAPARPTLYVNASRLNLRACPGMDCPKIAALERNEEVEPLSEAEDWTQVRVKRDGSLGWVASRYLSPSPVGPEAAPAPLPPPPPPAEGFQPAPPPAPTPPVPARPPLPEKPKPVRPAETPPVRPAPKPAEAAEPTRPKPVPEKPAPAPKPPAEERPAPPAPEPPAEPPKKIRIM